MNDPHEPTSDADVMDDLTIVRPRRAAPPDAEMDMTPMIDITFLLLIFFIVSSVVAQNDAVPLPVAQHGDAVSAHLSVIITVAETGDGEAVIYKGDGIDEINRLTSTDPVAQEQEMADYVAAGLAAAPAKRYVLIKAAKGVKEKHISRVSHAVGRVENVQSLYFAVMEAE